MWFTRCYTSMEKLDNDKALVKNFDSSSSVFFTTKLIVIIIAALILGAGTGYYFNQGGIGAVSKVTNSIKSSTIPKGTTEGSSDTSVFKDIAEGKLKEGGIEGEGAYHLVRSGGDSQNVYITSSTVDLGKYVGKKLKVWGQTQKAQHAGWLMDVGRIEVLE